MTLAVPAHRVSSGDRVNLTLNPRTGALPVRASLTGTVTHG